jgi:Bacterial Ig domain
MVPPVPRRAIPLDTIALTLTLSFLVGITTLDVPFARATGVAGVQSGSYSFDVSSFVASDSIVCNTYDFNYDFAAPPVVVVTADHYVAPPDFGVSHDPLAVWTTAITATQFDVCMQEYRGSGVGHNAALRVSWIALLPSMLDSSFAQAGTASVTTSSSGTTSCDSLTFSPSLSGVHLFVSAQLDSITAPPLTGIANSFTSAGGDVCASFVQSSPATFPTVTLHWIATRIALTPDSRIHRHSPPTWNTATGECKTHNFSPAFSQPPLRLIATTNHQSDPNTNSVNVAAMSWDSAQFRMCYSESLAFNGAHSDSNLRVDVMYIGDGASNTAPVATDNSYSVSTPGGSVALTPTSDDTDAESDPLVLVSVSTPLYGALTRVSSTEITYTTHLWLCDASGTLQESLTYTVGDGVDTDTGTITVDVSVQVCPDVADSPRQGIVDLDSSGFVSSGDVVCSGIVSFDLPFSTTPIILVTSQHTGLSSPIDDDRVTAWVRSVTTSQFEVCATEYSRASTTSRSEPLSVTYIAFESSSLDSSVSRAGVQTLEISSGEHEACFDLDYGTPLFASRPFVFAAAEYDSDLQPAPIVALNGIDESTSTARVCVTSTTVTAQIETFKVHWLATLGPIVLNAGPVQSAPLPTWTSSSVNGICTTITYPSPRSSAPSAVIATTAHPSLSIGSSDPDNVGAVIMNATATDMRVCIGESDANNGHHSSDALVLQFMLLDGVTADPSPPESECVLEDESCNYQPDPPVVTFSDVVIGNDNLAYYRIQMNASAHWSEYVKVLFPGSDNEHCDYPSGQVTWNISTATDDSCMKQYSVDIPVNDFLGKCGFTQTIRNGDSLFFQQTAQILTNRTCEDGRINQLSLSNVELSETRAITRETQYEIEIIAPTNVTAKSGDLEVFGTAFKLELLGDLTITPDIDTNMPTITGFFVTETQHPYELQDPVFELTGDFNYATFELTGTYCTADNTNRPACQQTWSYAFQPNETCPTKAQLEGDLVQIAWNVNCSAGFDGECAPSFAVQPEATFTLSSPVYCFSSDYIELTPALEVYQYDELTSNVADFGAAGVGALTNNGFSAERVFTIDSQLYAEFTVTAAGTGVTLTATTLKRVSTTTSSRGELVLYNTDDSTQASTFVVHDTGFGTSEASDFADYRTRFEFTWLNDTTVLLDSTEDLAQTIAVSATAISIFTNVQSLRKAGIDERHPVLSKLNSDRHSKEQEDKHMILFADGDEPRNSRSTVLARLAPASTTAPAASTASSGFVVSPTVAAAGIALIAIVALVAFAVIRHNKNSTAKPLPSTSSNVQLTGFAAPAYSTDGSTTAAVSPGDAMHLQSVATMYSEPHTISRV